MSDLKNWKTEIWRMVTTIPRTHEDCDAVKLWKTGAACSCGVDQSDENFISFIESLLQAQKADLLLEVERRAKASWDNSFDSHWDLGNILEILDSLKTSNL